MTVTAPEVLRHFLKLEARRPKYSHRAAELISWCGLSDDALTVKARAFAAERDDVNPLLVYTIGVGQDDRYTKVSRWERKQVTCRDIFAVGISPDMQQGIREVGGNICQFASKSASKYPEFRPLASVDELSSTVVLVAHAQEGYNGNYEVIDGAHRLVAFCLAGVEEVQAYVAHLI